jgi:HAD superfamily hydrolase (TIGR01450 family)
MALPPPITTAEMVERYDALLIDAYGVLVHSQGAFAGAVSLIEHLHNRQMPYAIITNDASRLPETCAAKYRRDGLEVPAEHIITSGSLLTDHFAQHQLQDARCLVLGPADSKRYAERAGGRLVELDDGDFDVLVIGDESGYDFVSTVDQTLTILFRKLDADEPVELILPNPDLIYQRSETSFGFTSGSVAGLFEAALASRYPGGAPRFDRLGKPYAPMFAEAVERVGTRRCAVIGDQLATDIKGANDYGLDSILVDTGLTDVERTLAHSSVRPDYLLASLTP